MGRRVDDDGEEKACERMLEDSFLPINVDVDLLVHVDVTTDLHCNLLHYYIKIDTAMRNGLLQYMFYM